MRSPSVALGWEIFRRNRRMLWAIAAVVVATWLFNLCLAGEFSANLSEGQQLLTINCLLMAASLLLLFSIFNYTEFDPQREWTGFPYRLFALPVTSLILVGMPVLLGVVSVELLYFMWVKLIFTHDQLARAEWLAVLIGAYMVFYQTILWTLAAFRILRIIVLGLVGVSFVGVAFLPFFGEFVSSPWLSEKVLSALICGLAVVAFSAAWVSIAHQRCGGGRQRSWLKYLIERIADALPRRRKNFASGSAAHFWYEWRRSGLLLPLSVGALLLLVIAPLSWLLRDDALGAVWILIWTLAMPIILAGPLGKSFSKPDFWSNDLAIPPFIAIRPLASGEMIVIKMKVAAVSAAVTWLLVLAFLSVWLPLWANLAPLMMLRIGISMSYNHSMWAEDVISILFIIVAAFVTWKFLVGGLWLGLSGNRKMFLASLAVYVSVPLLAFIGLTILLNHDQQVRAWATKDPDRVLAILEWIAALAVIAKFWLAARSWRNITPARVRAYLLLWTSATLVLLTLAILLWEHGLLALQLMSLMDILPVDVARLRNLLVLLALLVIPLARLGFAPSSLAKNRHR